MAEIDVTFDLIDSVEESEVQELLTHLRAAGVEADITQRHPPPSGMMEVGAIIALMTVSVSSVAALSVVAAFIYQVFRRGVVLNLTSSRPRVYKSRDLPRGSLLILYKDGRQELNQGLSVESMADLMKSIIDKEGSVTEDKEGSVTEDKEGSVADAR